VISARYLLLCLLSAGLWLDGDYVGRAHAQREPQVRVEMSADRTELSTNDAVTLRIFVQTQGSGQPDIEIPELEGFQVVQRAVQRPMQLSFGFGNAQPVVTSTTQYTFVLVPVGVGKFKIPPVQVSFGQRVFQSRDLVLTVTAPGDPGAATPGALGAGTTTGTTGTSRPTGTTGTTGAQPPAAAPSLNQDADRDTAADAEPANSGDAWVFDKDAFLRTVVDKVTPYEGEQVTATIYLYTRQNLQQVPAVQNEASTDGFWVQDLLNPTRALEPTRQIINGRAYWAYTLRRFAAFPLRDGDLSIGSMGLTISRESIFDIFDPAGRGPSTLQRKSVPVLLHVQPLPAESKPTGAVAVGDFQFESSLDRSQVATGDAVTWTVALRGRGNLRAVKLNPPATAGLQILQPEIRDLTESPNDRVQSTRTFQWLVVPQKPGEYRLPVLSLHTFDPETRNYKKLSTEPLQLTAAGAATNTQAGRSGASDAGAGVASMDTPDGSEGEADEAWPPLSTHSRLLRAQAALDTRRFYAGLLLLWPLLYACAALGPGALTRLRTRSEGDAEQLALRNAHKRLREAERALQARDARAFHAALATAISSSLEARLGENISGLTHSALQRTLIGQGMPEARAKSICEVLAACDFARFSSTQVDEDSMRMLLGRAEQLHKHIVSFAPRAREVA